MDYPTRSHANAVPTVPVLVRAVLSQSENLRRAGVLTQAGFEAQLDRLRAEELTPRNLTLVVRELPDGRTRFVVQTSAGAVCDTLERPVSPLRNAAFAEDGHPVAARA